MGSHITGGNITTPYPSPAISPEDKEGDNVGNLGEQSRSLLGEEENEPHTSKVSFDLEANQEKLFFVEKEESYEYSPPPFRHKSLWPNWFRFGDKLLPYQRLMTDQQAFDRSLFAIRFAVVAAAINIKLLTPNYPIMVYPGASPESFPNTDPFDFNSATYFIPMMAQLGIAIAGIFVGKISDKVGRKPVFLVSTFLAILASFSRYLAKESFWGFCITNLFTGLFSGTLPVGMAYVGDIFVTERDKAAELGILVGAWVFGSSFGGIVAILMGSTGLFKPLFIGSAMVTLSFFGLSRWMLDPGTVRLMDIQTVRNDQAQKNSSVDENAPTEIDQKALWNIVVGSLADNIGSCGLFPLCLSPLALNQFSLDFVEQGLDPIMEITGYQWLTVMVALMVIPSTLICPSLFAKIGVAASCVFGNACTAVVTFILLLLGNGVATNTKFAFFVFFLYAGFPLTVISQLTTGPMLDIIAPIEKRGYVQGLNSTVMNFGLAVSPWVLGILADVLSTNAAIFFGIVISVVAALINAPLMFRKAFQAKPTVVEFEKKPLLDIDGDDHILDLAQKGEWIHPEVLWSLNRGRIVNKETPILIHPKSFEEEKDHLPELAQNAFEDFSYRKERVEHYLRILAESENPDEASAVCKLINAQYSAKESGKQRVNKEIGQWFVDYLRYNGYRPHASPTLIKELIMIAFPPISKDEDVTPGNVEHTLLNAQRVFNKYMQDQVESSPYTLTKIYSSNGNFNVYG